MKWIDIWGDREFRVHSDYTLCFVTTCLHIENKFEKMNEKYISGESDDEVAFVVPEFFLKIDAIEKFHIRFCREFNGLSKYVIIFLKMVFYDDDIPKIQCLTWFFQGDILL
jgi:hypothetical protein